LNQKSASRSGSAAAPSPGAAELSRIDAALSSDLAAKDFISADMASYLLNIFQVAIFS
jgi:hypothetical protein